MDCPREAVVEGGDAGGCFLDRHRHAAVRHAQSGAGAQPGEANSGVRRELAFVDLERAQGREGYVRSLTPTGLTSEMSVVQPLAPVSRVLLRDRALERIRKAILAGQLSPGAVIKDAELARRLGLSVAPVRAALARLADEGLVETKPQSHTRVTPLRLGQIRDAVVVVRAMHELAAREAVPRITPDDVAAMRAANARFADAVPAGDLDAALTTDDELHGVLIRRCGNTALTATVDRFTPAIRRLERQRFGAAHGTGSVARHDHLIAACAAGDVATAVATTTEIWTALLSELEDAPDEP